LSRVSSLLNPKMPKTTLQLVRLQQNDQQTRRDRPIFIPQEKVVVVNDCYHFFPSNPTTQRPA
jgi:hypothetical protein